jgi:hypothetical protein
MEEFTQGTKSVLEYAFLFSPMCCDSGFDVVPECPAPAIAAESPGAKTPVDASWQERHQKLLASCAATAILDEDLQRKA